MINIYNKLLKLFSLRREKFSCIIYNITGIVPRTIGLYELALLHKSSHKLSSEGLILSNERLEFLGDAVLGAVVAHEFFNRYPEKDEGALTKMRSRVVNRTLLNKVGLQMNLGSVIIVQPQIELGGTHILGDAVEALVGAVYLDKGYDVAKSFILNKIIHPHFDISQIASLDTNFKSILIEWGQKNRSSIEFFTISQEGGDKTMNFCSQVYVGRLYYGDANAKSKKSAQQLVSKMALERLSKLGLSTFSDGF